MKKIVTFSSLLLGLVFLAGCGQQPASHTEPVITEPIAQNNQPVATQPADKTASSQKLFLDIEKYITKDDNQCLKNESDYCSFDLLVTHIDKNGECIVNNISIQSMNNTYTCDCVAKCICPENVDCNCVDPGWLCRKQS